MPDILLVDVETTGLHPHLDEIVQIAAVDLHDPNARFNQYVIPTNEVPEPVQQINSLSISKIKKLDGVSQKTGLLLFDQWVREYYGRGRSIPKLIIGGHNTCFDLSFLRYWYFRHSKPMDHVSYRPFDITSLFIALYESPLSGYSLDGIADHFGLRRRGKIHNAMEDIELTRQILMLMIEQCDLNGFGPHTP